jgi:hypothetical protein
MSSPEKLKAIRKGRRLKPGDPYYTVRKPYYRNPRWTWVPRYDRRVYMSAVEVARYLGYKEWYAHYLMRSGKIPRIAFQETLPPEERPHNEEVSYFKDTYPGCPRWITLRKAVVAYKKKHLQRPPISSKFLKSRRKEVREFGRLLKVAESVSAFGKEHGFYPTPQAFMAMLEAAVGEESVNGG